MIFAMLGITAFLLLLGGDPTQSYFFRRVVDGGPIVQYL